jgi:hypothetical protein
MQYSAGCIELLPHFLDGLAALLEKFHDFIRVNLFVLLRIQLVEHASQVCLLALPCMPQLRIATSPL